MWDLGIRRYSASEMEGTPRRVTFSALPPKQTNKEFLSSSHYKVTDGRTRQPPTGVTKEVYSGTDGHFRPPAAPLPPKGELFHADREAQTFTWSQRATSARSAHPHPQGGKSRAAEERAGTFLGVKGPGTNYREHYDKQLVAPGYSTQNMKELPGRDPAAAHTPSAPTLMRDFMRHGDEQNIPRPRSSYRDTLASDGQTQTVNDAAHQFSGNLSFRRLRSLDRDPMPGLDDQQVPRYRPSTASEHRGVRGKSANISTNPLYSYRGHTSVPEGDRVKSAVPDSRNELFEEDYPEHSMHGHTPYNKPLAFDAILGTNARLGVDGAPIVDGPSSTRRSFPEKEPLEPITRAPPAKKNITVIPGNDDDPDREVDRKRLTSARVSFRQPPATYKVKHVPFNNSRNLHNVVFPTDPEFVTFETSNSAEYSNRFRDKFRADPPPSYNIPLDYGYDHGHSVTRYDFPAPESQRMKLNAATYDGLSRSHWVDEEKSGERPLQAESFTTHSHRPQSSRARDRPDTGKVHRSNLPMEPAREQFQHALPAAI